MNRILSGFMVGALILALIFFYVSESQHSPNLMTDVPDWIQGTLLVTTRGNSDKNIKNLTDQYVCAFDFSADTIQTVRVPINATMIQDNKTGKPLIVYEANNSYFYYDDTYSFDSMKWRNFFLEEIVYEDSRVISKVETKQLGRINKLDAPLAVLGASAVSEESFLRAFFSWNMQCRKRVIWRFQLVSSKSTAIGMR